MEHFLSPSQCEADIPGDIRNGNHCRGRIFQLAICDLQENGMCCMLLKTIVLGLREPCYLPSKEREGSSFSNHGHNKIQNLNNSKLLFFSKFCLCKFATFVSYLTLTRLKLSKIEFPLPPWPFIIHPSRQIAKFRGFARPSSISNRIIVVDFSVVLYMSHILLGFSVGCLLKRSLHILWKNRN